MCGSGSCGCGGSCAVCKLFSAVVTLILTLTTAAALIGVYVTHMTPAGWVFGTVEGSMALLTLILSSVAWLKVFKKMCPCGKKSCCSGSGGMSGGKCPMCGKDPCKCK